MDLTRLAGSTGYNSWQRGSHGCCSKLSQSWYEVTMMDAERNHRKWTLFSAKVVAYTTLVILKMF